jgi:addiction module RelE/StbE family toxin
MAKVNWTDQALNDLIHIAEYIAQDSVKYSKITVDRIRSRARELREYPQLGRVVPEVDSPVLRELIMGNYRIIYFIHSRDSIDILSVHHSAKRLIIDDSEASFPDS